MPRRVEAPWAWTCAAACVLLMVTAGAVLGMLVADLSDTPAYAGPVYVPDAVDPGLTSDHGLAPDASLEPVIDEPPAATVPTVPAPTLPPNVEADVNGALRPRAGCRWLNDDPQDLRVVCEGATP